MSEKPILFSGPMVRAILEGRKTQTRRIAATPGHGGNSFIGRNIGGKRRVYRFDLERERQECVKECPYGRPGDRLWVKEAHRLTNCTCEEACRIPGHVWYEADSSGYDGVSLERLRPSIHMPRWASRITLEITGVRVERLQDISDEDAIAEGIARADGAWASYSESLGRCVSPVTSYRTLWESINGKGSWGANPWVWAITFKRL